MIEIDKIYLEDCLEGMKRIDDGSVDCIITDLPYGTTACAWDTVIPFDRLWEQYRRITKPNAAIVLFGSEPFSTMLRASNIKDYRYDWYWHKPEATGHLQANLRPMRDIECISVFYRKQCTYNPQFTKGEPYKQKSGQVRYTSEANTIYFNKEYGPGTRNDNPGIRYPKQCIEFTGADRRKTLHPTQKPVSLIEYLVLTYTNKGDLVLDSCMGSGTTAIACIKAKRHFVGFETDEGYFRQAEKRIWEERRQTTLDFEDVP